MTDFDRELEELRTEVAVPDLAAQQRISARLARSIGAVVVGETGARRPALSWANPLQLAASLVLGGLVGAGLYGALRPPRVERVYIERPAPLVSAPPQTSG